MKDIYYVNSAGVKLDLLTPPYLLQTGDLFDYEWDYDSTSTSLNGGEITEFYRSIKEKDLTLSVVNYGKGSYYAAIDRFYETVEYDVLQKKPGRMYFGDSYLQCFLIASKKSEWESDASLLDNDVTLVVPMPVWTTEQKMSLFPQTFESGEVSKGLEYPYDYEYEYAGQYNLQYLQNTDFVGSNFSMIIYGPCLNPYVRIGGHLYEVKTTLYAGEYLVIDSRARTVIKHKVYGDTENLFADWSRDSYIFEKIPAGRNAVTWPGTFGVDIILFHERSEPPWNS